LLPQGWPALTSGIALALPPSLECLDHLPRGRFRDRGAAARGDAAAVLVLHLEPLDGEVRIVEALVERQGATDGRVLACVQGALRGLSVPLPTARAGPRQRLRYPLR
jgi:hypothetical protein